MSDPIKRGRGRPKTPQPPAFVQKWEYATLSSERPFTAFELWDGFGSNGWELVSVYVQMDAVHAVFKREVTQC